MNPLEDYGMTDKQYSYCADMIELEARHKNYKVIEVHLGGSAARKTMQSHSDFDVFVYVDAASKRVDNSYISLACNRGDLGCRIINIKIYKDPKNKPDRYCVTLGGKKYKLTHVDFYTGERVCCVDDDVAFLEARHQHRFKSRWIKPGSEDESGIKLEDLPGDCSSETEIEEEVAYEQDNL